MRDRGAGGPDSKSRAGRPAGAPRVPGARCERASREIAPHQRPRALGRDGVSPRGCCPGRRSVRVVDISWTGTPSWTLWCHLPAKHMQSGAPSMRWRGAHLERPWDQRAGGGASVRCGTVAARGARHPRRSRVAAAQPAPKAAAQIKPRASSAERRCTYNRGRVQTRLDGSLHKHSLSTLAACEGEGCLLSPSGAVQRGTHTPRAALSPITTRPAATAPRRRRHPARTATPPQHAALSRRRRPRSRRCCRRRRCRRRAAAVWPAARLLAAHRRTMAEPAPATLMPLADLRLPDDLGEKVRVAGL